MDKSMGGGRLRSWSCVLDYQPSPQLRTEDRRISEENINDFSAILQKATGREALDECDFSVIRPGSKKKVTLASIKKKTPMRELPTNFTIIDSSIL